MFSREVLGAVIKGLRSYQGFKVEEDEIQNRGGKSYLKSRNRDFDEVIFSLCYNYIYPDVLQYSDMYIRRQNSSPVLFTQS